MTSSPPAVFWFRNDLRVHDNPALLAAAAEEGPLTVVYILDDETPGSWKRGGASRWWLHHSLKSLSETIASYGGQLLLKRGRAREVMLELTAALGARRVYWNRRYEPWAIACDTEIKSALKARGIEARSFNGSLSVEPWDIATKQGKPYRVFTPFWRALKSQHRPGDPAPAPQTMAWAPISGSDALEDWDLLPRDPDWSHGIAESWEVGEDAAKNRLEAFVAERLNGYDSQRNIPSIKGTSRLSPHLHFGEISPRQIWAAVESSPHGDSADADSFLSEIGWRDFSYNLLYHFPTLPDENFQTRFDTFDWTGTAEALKAWQRGLTGYPIVDAGMRELWHTGWMHNRVRMIVGSFLIKDLMIHWKSGEDWFWDTLVDADLASNAAGWQWVAGSGADAAPYFRIFNPVSQGEKFDPDGEYVRKWIPELARLPKRVVHAPWTADRDTLARAGLVLGRDYPKPIVDHAQARQSALAAFEKIKDVA